MLDGRPLGEIRQPCVRPAAAGASGGGTEPAAAAGQAVQAETACTDSAALALLVFYPGAKPQMWTRLLHAILPRKRM